MRFVITGASGYIASNLIRFLRSQDLEVVAVSQKELTDEQSVRCALNDKETLESVLLASRPDVIVHTAWVNSLAQCEKDPEGCRVVNVENSLNLLRVVKENAPSAKVVFLSSDYVFDGKRGGYIEADARSPNTVYGSHKVEVENAIRESGLTHLIIRTANVFTRGGRFFDFLYEHLMSGKRVEAYADAYFTPTYMDYLLDSLLRLIERNVEGLYHLAGPQRVSRYQFGIEMARVLNCDDRLVIPAMRPVGSPLAYDVSLNSSRARNLINNWCPMFSQAVSCALGRLLFPYFSYFDDRGGIFGIIQDEAWEEINYVESAAGSVRGGHYHGHTREGFFIIEGRVLVTLRSMASGVEESFVVDRGDAFCIEPNTVHTFKVIQGARWINFLSRGMKGADKDILRPDQR